MSTSITLTSLPLVVSSLSFLLLLSSFHTESTCLNGCDLALASYYISPGTQLQNVALLFGIDFANIDSAILVYNPSVTSKDNITSGSRINVPFSCDCIDGDFLGHAFPYKVLAGDTYDTIATKDYANLTTADWLGKVNRYPATNLQVGVLINATVNCSCGDSSVTRDYGLFVTYPLRVGQTLASVAAELQFPSTNLLQQYNPGVNFSSGKGIVFVPTKDTTGSYRPLKLRSKGISGGAIAGIVIAALVLLVLAVCVFLVICRRKKTKKAQLLTSEMEISSTDVYTHPSAPPIGGSSPFTGIVTVDNSVEFSYEELAEATNDFSLANKIGSGGFGDVYFAELRGEKTAIKKMDMQASKEFLAELKVLTHVHHLNLVRLIGYCTENSLFLVYEYIENGNLSQHLRGSGKQTLSWLSRVQIALDSARGLEYIHEHTVPVYIHRDIKSANILIDNSLCAKVADFGLAKLTGVGNTQQTRVAGTFGYMAPEYAQYGELSPKIDVYAFGVLLYELISAKHAIIKADEASSETRGLVTLFDDVLSQPGETEQLRKLVDPRLNDNYPIDDVRKMALLGKACTEFDPHQRPRMQSVVVALMILSSSTAEWDVGSFFGDQSLANLMSGR